MGTYRFIDHTADIAVELEGETPADLFTAAAEAFRKAALNDSPVAEKESRRMELTAADMETLLVDFLNELNFWLLTRHWAVARVQVENMTADGENWRLTATAFGEPFDERRHSLEVEIKSATYHQMAIEEKNGRFRTRLVFDI